MSGNRGSPAATHYNRYRFNATYGTEFTLNYNAMMLKDSLLLMRAFDVTRALTYVECYWQDPSLYAEGWLGVVALIAAAVKKDSRVSSLEFDAFCMISPPP